MAMEIPVGRPAAESGAVCAPSARRRGLDALFAPRVVAVVGAGRTRGGIGAEIFHNLRADGFTGRAIPINPSASAIDGVRAYASLREVPEPIDLAVVAVPADAVEPVIDDCVAAGIPAAIVISAGFAETGDAGRQREARLLRTVREAGMRMVGPNCMGLVNTDAAVRLNATFSPVFPPAGPVAFSTQSGALGLAILEYARQLNLGISSFASVGNKADVSTNDLIEYWAGDQRTRVILLYVESFGNPRRFADIARRVGRTKPIVALKAGRSGSGARAARSHTGALAASDVVVDALFRDAGVIRTGTLEELFDAAALLAHQPLPAGPRVAILTNAGGPGILAADACEAHGLVLPPLSPATVEALRRFLPTSASVANPVDMIATASADDYRRAIPVVLADAAIDRLLTIFIPPLVTRSEDVARAIAGATRGSAKPVLATFFGAAGVPDLLAPVPCYTFPESAARALAHAVTYAQWRAQPPDAPAPPPRMHVDAARRIVERACAGGDRWLAPLQVQALLEAVGIPATPVSVAHTADEAVAAARHFGLPVAVKGSGPDLLHKSDAQAVFTGIDDEAGVQHAFAALARRPGVAEVLVQPMIAGGVEMFVGATLHPAFGHAVICGSGGMQVELLRDTACRLAPVGERALRELLDEVRGVALLRGFRGRPRLDEAALRDVVLRVSALLVACPEILELDLNPVIVTRAGAHVVDARVRVGRGGPPASGPRGAC